MKVPVEVLVHSKTKTLELAYEDGTRAFFPFEFLRVFSPSAEVQGHSPEEAVLQVGCANVGLRGVEFIAGITLKSFALSMMRCGAHILKSSQASVLRETRLILQMHRFLPE